MRASTSVMVLVFRNIGQVRKIGKRPNDRNRLITSQFFQQFVQFGAGLRIGLAPKTHGGLANGFHHVENGFAFLVAQHVTQQATK